MSAPIGWRVLTLAEVAESGLFSDGDWVESKDQDPGGAIRLTQLADIGLAQFRDRSNRWLRHDQAAALGCTFLEPGDVLIARMPDPIGRACLVPETLGAAVTAVDVAILRIKKIDIDARYVMWAINSPQFHAAVVAQQSGTTRKRISRKNLAALSIPVPPLEEQQRIIELLEDHLSRLDAGVSGLQDAGRRIDIFEAQTIRAALTGRAVAGRHDVQIRTAGMDDGELAPLPRGWHWMRLGELADVVGGVTKDSNKQSDTSFIGVPYLRVANVQRGHLNLRTITDIRVSPKKAEALRLLPGDVLLNEGGDRDKLGRGWVWEGQIEDCIHQNHVFRARVRGGQIDPYLLSWAANSIGGRWCERNGKQSVNLASISLSKIRLMPVPVPPPNQQAELRQHIEAVVDGCRTMRNEITASRTRSVALKRSLLEAAFSGRLTASTADTEMAEEMTGV